MSDLITPVILSGGSGTRLWPLSLPERPKQLLSIGSDRSMLQETALRTRDHTRFAPPIVVANLAHAEAIEAQLADVDCAPGALVLEPAGRNTAPAIALAALAAAPDALLLVMPSDHTIWRVNAFLDAVLRAAPLARDGWLVTFGIEPEHPETGFGYIKLGEPLSDGVHQVERFVEKPPLVEAQRMLRDGGYAWNGGIFMFRAGAYLDALAKHAPEILSPVKEAVQTARRDGARILPDARRFADSPSDSIDYAVMEKADRVAIVPVSMDWSDVGSWDAVHALGPHDEDGTVALGDVVALDTSNCLVRSDGPTIATLGVSDLIVVATGRHVLVLPRGRSQEVKRLLEAVKERDTD
ncbi:mannose-1-phosphate guanylyltransferase/mannose-6-phosphate isomerase [Sphingomonas tabacisoli]|uniref:Mannose-1-phosphate guanylyltransferase/mannose-6-phosphate isomerase n=1 Tax=Sphingomonas tabacisoli TaxID=2249466 RepID=A0ABW4HXY1_9SPHN